jgi:hypothetical protein
MKKLILVLLALSSANAFAEDWKGPTNPNTFDFSALAGLGIFDSKAGFALVGAAAYKIQPEGFIPEISDEALIELEAGPLFLSGGTAFVWSSHLRWDFNKDPELSFYAIGGLGGLASGSDLGSAFRVFPRFGVGTIWNASAQVTVRGEVSHELVVAGVSFAI